MTSRRRHFRLGRVQRYNFSV